MKKSIYLKETAVILTSTPYNESGSVVKAFTQDNGLLSFFVKGGQSAKGRLSPFEPFALGELSYEESSGSLNLLREFSVHDYHLPLRESLDRIQSAALMADALDKTQGPGLEAPALFALFCLYLKWMPRALDPYTLAASFYLKTLKHEGLLHLTPDCPSCGTPLNDCLLSEGTAVCNACSHEGIVPLNPAETRLILLLSQAREFKEIKEETIAPGLLNSLRTFFEKTLL